MDVALVLEIKYPDSEYALVGNPETSEELDVALTWYSETSKPTLEELTALWSDTQYVAECKKVSDNRYFEYVRPGGPDSVFMKYQREEATKQEWLDAVTAINEANPYPLKESA